MARHAVGTFTSLSEGPVSDSLFPSGLLVGEAWGPSPSCSPTSVSRAKTTAHRLLSGCKASGSEWPESMVTVTANRCCRRQKCCSGAPRPQTPPLPRHSAWGYGLAAAAGCCSRTRAA